MNLRLKQKRDREGKQKQQLGAFLTDYKDTWIEYEFVGERLKRLRKES